MKSLRVVCSLVFMMQAGSLLVAQTHLTRDAVDSALDSSLFELGPVRITPFVLFNSGYDSNSFSSSSASQDDYTMHFGPGARFVIPTGQRGFFEIQPELDYVYYDEQSSLRNLNSRLDVGGALGTRRIMFRLSNGFSDGIARPTSEFDVPVQMRKNELQASAHVLVGWRQEIRLNVAVNEQTLRDEQGAFDSGDLNALLGFRQLRYGAEVQRYMTSRTRFVFKATMQQDDFDDLVARDAESLHFQGGFTFGELGAATGRARLKVSNTRGLFGRALFGYQRTTPDSDAQARFAGFTTDVNAGIGFAARDRLRMTFSRSLNPSVLSENWFFIENRLGADAVLYLGERLFFSPGVFYNRNAYPRPELVSDELGRSGLAFIRDRQWTYRLGVNVHLSEEMVLRVNLDYLRRSSNFSEFSKNRFLIGAGVSYAR